MSHSVISRVKKCETWEITEYNDEVLKFLETSLISCPALGE
jgi:hypothetical protein